MALLYAKWCVSKLVGLASPIEFRNGFRFAGFRSFSEYLLWRKGLDQEDLRILHFVASSQKRSGGLVAFDVGANLGLFSLALCAAGFHEVHAFEPIPDTFCRLQENLKLNPTLAGPIVLNSVGLGAQSGLVDFIFNSVSPAQSKIATHSNSILSAKTLVPCEVVTLDAYFKSCALSHISFLKMDVEGFETDVLQGGKEILSRGLVQFIYSEVIPRALVEAGSSLSEFNQLLHSLGFEPVVLSCNDELPILKVTLEEALERGGPRRNVLFRRMQ
jgi:FkbM family methyltransferase